MYNRWIGRSSTHVLLDGAPGSSVPSRLRVLALVGALGVVGATLLGDGDTLYARTLEPAEAASSLLSEGPYAAALALEDQGDWFGALELARQAQSVAAEDPLVMRLMARLLMRTGAIGPALEQVKRWQEAEPQEPASYLLAALSLRDQGRAEAAIEELEVGLSRKAVSTELVQQLALLRVELGRLQQAEELVQQRLSASDSVAKAVTGLAAAADPGRIGEALKLLPQAIEAGSAMGQQLTLEFARVLADSGDVASAIGQLRALSTQQDAPSEVFYRLARLHQRAGREDEAEEALGRFEALRKREEEVDRQAQRFGVGLNDAQQLAKSNQLDEALSRVQGLNLEFPQKHPALALEGKLLFSMKRYESAYAPMAAASALAPGELEYAYLAGLFAAQSGQLELAREDLNRALLLDPTFELAQRVLSQVESLLEQARRLP